jgi:hypothetical protein
VRHCHVHGGFKGTDTRFTFYFPFKKQYKGRFFQYITPVPDSETLSQGASGEEDKIGFSISIKAAQDGPIPVSRWEAPVGTERGL